MDLNEAIIRLEFHRDWLAEEVEARLQVDDDADIEEDHNLAKAITTVLAAIKSVKGGE